MGEPPFAPPPPSDKGWCRCVVVEMETPTAEHKLGVEKSPCLAAPPIAEWKHPLAPARGYPGRTVVPPHDKQLRKRLTQAQPRPGCTLSSRQAKALSAESMTQRACASASDSKEAYSMRSSSLQNQAILHYHAGQHTYNAGTS